MDFENSPNESKQFKSIHLTNLLFPGWKWLQTVSWQCTRHPEDWGGAPSGSGMRWWDADACRLPHTHCPSTVSHHTTDWLPSTQHLQPQCCARPVVWWTWKLSVCAPLAYKTMGLGTRFFNIFTYNRLKKSYLVILQCFHNLHLSLTRNLAQ